MKRGERPFGFNVIGNITANAGLGVAARNLIDLIVARGHPVAAYDVPAGRGRDGRELAHESYLVDHPSKLPHAINIFVFPISALHFLLPQFATQLDYESYFNASLCYWELPTVPPRWVDALESLDALIATSDYMAHVYRCAVSDTEIVEGPLPVKIPDIVSAPRFRAAHGIPPDAVVFVTAFDPSSDPARKNPMATIDAFIRGIGEDTRAYLIVRMNNATLDGVEHDAVGTLRRATAAHPRIVLDRDPLSYADIIALYAECDVFVSLHRAEGLGLAMAEAMLLGKPVIATAWSGNLTYMDRFSACLVRYRLVPITDATSYNADELEDTTVWADANADEAAMWMRRLVREPEVRWGIGEAARRRMLAYNRDADEGRFLNELQQLREQSEHFPRLEKSRNAGDRFAQLRAGRLARYQALERELRWIKSRRSYRIATRIKRIVKSNPLLRLFGVPRD